VWDRTEVDIAGAADVGRRAGAWAATTCRRSRRHHGIADVFVVNKSDREGGSRRSVRDLNLSLQHSVPAIGATCTEDEATAGKASQVMGSHRELPGAHGADA
jgi:hypothetical protein